MHPSDEIREIKSNLLKNKKIILALTGSIASVETVKLSRELIRHGAEVIPIMSNSATEIIHPYSLEFATGNKPILQLTGKTEHVFYCGKVRKHADLLLISPCTANTISKIAHGIDDNVVTTFATTAIGSNIPIIIVPAMHLSMYDHKIVQNNIESLKKNGIIFIDPAITSSKAKIASIEDIISKVIRKIGKNDLSNKKILVIGGSTQESIDDIRYISNKSSGKTALNFALNSYYRGADVEVWCGCSEEKIPSFIKTKYFKSITDLNQLLKINDIVKFDVIILCAALSDYTIDKKNGKIKSDKTKLILELKPSQKIISKLRQRSPNSIIIGFKLDENEKKVKEGAIELLIKNKLDYVVANSITAINSEKNKIWLFDKNNNITELNGKKSIITDKILTKII